MRRRMGNEEQEEEEGKCYKNPRGCKKQGNVKNTLFFLFITLGFPCLLLNTHFQHIPARSPVTLLLVWDHSRTMVSNKTSLVRLWSQTRLACKNMVTLNCPIGAVSLERS